MRWREWWRWRAEDMTEEARRELRKLHMKGPEVARLGRELRDVQRRNNFSGMVTVAISQAAREETVL